ncbi:MAG: FRG domain-containing protein [Burkholderiales bacterium]|nr:FRG domain-containing protein [Burkholderiales bacterium]
MSQAAKDFLARVESWSDLSDLVEHFSFYSANDWLFRGVTNVNHTLIAKIGREKARIIKRGPGSPRVKRVPYRLADERAIFTMFKSQALAYLQRPPTTPLEWLALAQHFGMPTRLLDWTESILIAAWFAVENAGAKEDGADAAIWVAHGVSSIDAEDPCDPFKVKSPCVYRPAHVSARIAAQGSVLMLCPKPTEKVKLAFVRKITIARRAEFTIKKRLNTCGVNKRLLFPDLQGLAEHLSWLHKHDYLAGYSDGAGLSIRPTPDEEEQ